MRVTNLQSVFMTKKLIILSAVFMALFSVSAFAADKKNKVKVAKNAPVFTKFVYQERRFLPYSE